MEYEELKKNDRYPSRYSYKISVKIQITTAIKGVLIEVAS